MISQTLEIGVVGREALGRPRREVLPGAVGEGEVELPRHPPRDVGLHLEHVGERGVERLLPLGGRGRSRRHLYQLGDHPDPALPGRTLLPANLPDQQILHAQLLGDLLRRLGGVLVLSGAAARDDLEALEPGQLAADLVGHAVGEVLVGGVAQVLEGEDGEEAVGAGALGLRAAVGAKPAEQPTETDQDAEDERWGRYGGTAGRRDVSRGRRR